jgi:hypothetical protein
MARMGRPPIGKRAMTSTERSRRYRAGLKRAPEPTTKPSPERDRSADKDQEVTWRERKAIDTAQLESIIRLLEEANEILDEMLSIERIEAAPDGRIHLTLLATQARKDEVTGPPAPGDARP